MAVLELYDHYCLILEWKKFAETQSDKGVQAFTALRQSDTNQQLELQRLFNEHRTLHDLHADHERQITDITTRLRRRTNTYTDLQIKYNTQATEFETAKSDARELRSKLANLQ